MVLYITCLQCQLEGLSWQQPHAVPARADRKLESSMAAVLLGSRQVGARASVMTWASTSAAVGNRRRTPWLLAFGRPPAGVVCCSPGA